MSAGPLSSSTVTNAYDAADGAARRAPSLRLRLTLWMVIIAMVIQLTLGLVVFLYQNSALNHLFDDRIRQRSLPLAQFLAASDVRMVSQQIDTFAQKLPTFPTDEPRFVAIYDSLRKPVAFTTKFAPPDALLPVAFARASSTGATLRHTLDPHTELNSSSAGPWRIIARRFTDTTGAEYFLIVGRPDHTFDSMLQLIQRVLVLALPAGVIGVGVSGWLIAGLALAPVKRLREMAADTLAPETIEKPVHLDVGVAEYQGVQAVLEQMRDRIRNAFVARDRFIASVSHELKTPIAVILTEAQTLDARGLNKEARVFVRSVIDETRRLSRTIESFLTLTKIRAGKSLMEHGPCVVSDFVMDAVLGCSRMARQQQVAINPLLSDTEQPREINGDCELLRVMIDNLLRNAIRFSPRDTQVLVHVTESPTDSIITVRDYGPPATPGPITSTLEPSAPVNGTSERRAVTLGLSIAQTIAELHGGGITAQLADDGGCEFVVHLPSEIIPPGATGQRGPAIPR